MNEPDCGAVGACLAACAPGDNACVFGCAAAHSVGWTLYYTRATCNQHHCGSECGTSSAACGLADLPYLAGNPACGDCNRASCCEEGLSCGEDVACNEAAGCVLSCVGQQPSCPQGGVATCMQMPGWAKWQAMQDCTGQSCSAACGGGGGGGGGGPECSTNADCTDPDYPVCAPDGTCGECASNAQCQAIDASYPFCVDAYCVECTSNAQCGGLTCVDNYCE